MMAVVGLTQFQIGNGLAPKKGPLVVRVPMDFTVYSGIDFDFTELNESDKFGYAQACYIDNSLNPSNLILHVHGAPHHMTWPAFSQGCLPVLQVGTMKARVSTGIGVVVAALFTNVPMAPFMYPVPN